MVTSGTFHIAVYQIMSTLLSIILPSVGIVIRCSILEKANFLGRIIRPESYFIFVGIYLTFRRFLKITQRSFHWVFWLLLRVCCLGTTLLKFLCCLFMFVKSLLLEVGYQFLSPWHYSILFHSPRQTQLLWLLLQWPCILDVKCY